MGDMADVCRDMTAAKKQRHSDWHKQNMAIMEKSGLPYDIKNDGEVLIVNGLRDDAHIKGKPQVQFWPSTGRWRARNKTYSGGAKSFINWYKKQ